MRRSLLFAVLLALVPGLVRAAEPPKQPVSGPGGSEYSVAKADIVKKFYGKGSEQVFVFRPGIKAEKPRAVVIFLHAFGAISPKHYGAWIEHLVRRGHIVIYPRYQDSQRVARSDLTKFALAGVRTALTALERDAPGEVDPDRVAVLGHAAGGIIAANYAARAPGLGLPRARLVYAATPGNSHGSPRLLTPLDDLTTLDDTVMIVSVVAERDLIARETDARKIIRTAWQVSPARKMLIKLASDDHGRPILSATHFAAGALNNEYDAAGIVSGDPAPPPEPAPPPGARGRRPPPPRPAPVAIPGNELDLAGAVVDALDWYGFWKTFDMAMDAVNAGADTTPIKQHPSLAGMGTWTDGWPVRRLTFESARENVPPPPPGQATAKPKR